MICSPNVNCAEVLLQILIFGLTNGAVLALNAISITVVYSTVRTLNLAHGDVFALSTTAMTTLLISLGAQRAWPPLLLLGALALAAVAAILVGVVLNVAIDQLAFKPFRGRSRLAPLIATLGISFMLFQAALVWRTLQRSWVWHEHRSVPGLPEVPTDSIPNLLPDVNLIRMLGLPLNINLGFSTFFILIVAIGCAIGVSLLLRRTAIGRAIRACAQHPQLAQICGVNIDRTIRRAFMLGGVLVGLAAIVFALYYARPFGQAGAESGLLAFAAAILGGIGSPIGALISALVLGIFSSFSDYFLSAQWTPVLQLALLIGLLVLRPTGIAGKADGDDPSGTLRDSILLSAPDQRARSHRRLAWILVGLAIFPVISALSGLGWQILLRGIGIFILLALGLNILLGLAGILDLGFAVSFAIGGYTTALLTNRFSDIGVLLPQPVDFTLAVLCSMALAGLFGAFKGGIARRLRSDYLAVATLALGLLAQRVIINLKSLTGGAGGMAALPPPTFFAVPIGNQTAQFYLVFGCVVAAAVVSLRLIASRSGRAWLANSYDETASASFGINVAHYQLLALVLSSAMAGLAGALYASTFSFVLPDMAAFHITTLALTMVILGGAGSVSGVILGAMLIIGYDQIIVPKLAAFIAALSPPDALFIGSSPDIRGTSFFNFGLALYLTVLWRGRRREKE